MHAGYNVFFIRHQASARAPRAHPSHHGAGVDIVLVEDGERVVADDVGEGVAGLGPDHRVVVAVAVVPVGGHICLFGWAFSQPQPRLIGSTPEG